MEDKALVLIECGKASGPRIIGAARRLGLRPIMLAREPDALAYLAAEEGVDVVTVDTMDHRKVVDACLGLGTSRKIVGVTTNSDSFIEVAASAARQLGLPGPDPEALGACRDKFAQRRRLSRAGVPTPAFHLASTVSEAARGAMGIGLPVIVKPVTGRGSSGVRLCRNIDEVVAQTEFLLAGRQHWPSPPRVLVEEYALGPFYCVESMGLEAVGVSRGYFCRPPHFTYSGFSFPAAIDVADHERVVAVGIEALRALGLGWGPANVEMRLTRRGPVIIEVNPRMAGACVPDLIKLAYGIDLTEQTIRLCTGERPRLGRSRAHTAAIRFLMPECDGALARIRGVGDAAEVPGVECVSLLVRPGQQISRKGDVRDHLGYVIAASPASSTTEFALRKACDSISFDIEAASPSPPAVVPVATSSTF